MVEYNKTDNLDNITFIKCVLMIIIVFYHSILFLNGEWFGIINTEKDVYFATFAEWLNSFHIYAFTFISGYLFYYLKFEKNKYVLYLPFVVNKIKRLIVPYCFIALVWAMPVYELFYKAQFVNLVKKFVLGESPNQLWFLLMLFWVFVMAWPLDRLLKKDWMIIIPLGIFAIGTVANMVLPNYFQLFTACKFFIYFYLGFKVREKWEGKIEKIPFWCFILVDLSVFAVWLLFKDKNDLLWKLFNTGWKLVLNAIGCLMVWTTSQTIAKKVNEKNNGLIMYLSRRNMIIYLLHQQIIYFCIYFLNGIISNYLIVIVNFVVSFAVSLLIANVILKFKVTRMLMGEN